MRYPSGIRNIPLDQLELVPVVTEEPLELLHAGRFSDPARLRQVLAHIRLTGRLADVIYSMAATNTQFMAHQFKPVLKMLSSPTGNLLIADEVGLGKTIEAGLIWTELRARFDYGRALVVCPKVLCRKWQDEMSSKFGLDAQVLSTTDLLAILESQDRWSRGFVGICSLQGLKPPAEWEDEESPHYSRPSARLARLLRDREGDSALFDLLVVDEAHHLRNPNTQSNRLARLLQPVSHHQVFLSATPIHLRSRDLFSLLTLLDPDTFTDLQSLSEIMEANQPLIEARQAVMRGAPLQQVRTLVDQASWCRLLSGSQQITTLLHELDALSDPVPESERARLASRLDQMNLLANTVNRTRRRDVTEFRVVRKVTAYKAVMAAIERDAYDAITAEVQRIADQSAMAPAFLLATPQRLLASCLPAAVDHWRKRQRDAGIEDGGMGQDDAPELDDAQLGPLVERLAKVCAGLPPSAELERHDSKFQQFTNVLESFLRSCPDEKAVVFSTFRPTLAYLARRLAKAGIRCEMIHGGTPHRDAALDRFKSDDCIRVLLSSEIGSEGIDLQFCRAMVNYDLPWNPMRVEQRIGRIDRVGQAAEDVSVINLLHTDTIDEVIYDRLYQRLKLCEQALGGFEAVLGEEIAKLTPQLLRSGLTLQEQAERVQQSSQAVENRMRLETELEAEAAALIAHGDTVLASIHAANDMHRWIGARDLARYLGDALVTLYPGCLVRDTEADDIYEIRLTSEARAAYGGWLSGRHPAGSRLIHETGAVRCRLGRPALGRGAGRAIEAVTQTHPLIRFVSSKLAETDAPQLRPAVAARIPAGRLHGAGLSPGRYVVVAMLWRFGGRVEQELIAYAGLTLPGGTLISAAQAEDLLRNAADMGALWPEAGGALDIATLHSQCDAVLLPELDRRFQEEGAARTAEDNDRAAIQLRTLDKRFGEQRSRLATMIERQRHGGATGIAVANEGRLRRLMERYAVRRGEIERGRRPTLQEEQLAVAVIEVTQ